MPNFESEPSDMEIEKLRQICLALPGASEEIKWGEDLCFVVGAKMFCVAGMHDGHITLKVRDEDFADMTEREGISPAPYLGRNNWVIVQKGNKLKPKEWGYYIKQSYELVKAKLPKRVQRELGE
jgi:predicted DNA-binding protein (MmcQ/YjbR family)